jgi:diguanylate cyclase (GGDEF)-like protein
VRRLFLVYAAATFVPVLLLGAVLLVLLADQGRARGLAEGRARADLIARTAIAPLLDGGDLRPGLTPAERASLGVNVGSAVSDHDIVRLRLRDLDGDVVYSDDGSTGEADDEALDAAAGRTVAHLTWLNDDDEDAPRGPRVVEVYEPVVSSRSGARIGVLELYLPYAPIAADIAHGRRSVTTALATGLLLLWLCVLAVSASVMRHLRRQSAAHRFVATHDVRTGLPNRTEFSRLLEAATAAQDPASPVAVALLDLDRFRDVNDALGYANGDLVIETLARRLVAELRPDDVLARLGGDEFGIVLVGAAEPAATEQVLQRLRSAVARPLEINGIPLTVEAGVGWTGAATHDEPASLLRRADIALSVSKNEHRGVVRYETSHDTYDSSALVLVAQLGDAITRGELLLHYQPKMDVRSGGVTAVEALVRWQHPTRGLLYPDAFLSQVEQTELIDDLTRWLLRTVGTTLPSLDPSGRLSVAVNISARSLIRADFADEVVDALAATGTDPGRIILEITETAILADPPRALESLSRLHDAGLRISVDDFGAGQTSLAYLATMPISELKIDKAFVMSMADDRRNAAIVRSVVDLGHSLGFSVTAEGVETVEALRTLTTLGCDTVQGYLLSRPVAPADLDERLRAATATMLSQSALRA